LKEGRDAMLEELHSTPESEAAFVNMTASLNATNKNFSVLFDHPTHFTTTTTTTTTTPKPEPEPPKVTTRPNRSKLPTKVVSGDESLSFHFLVW
jgi:hypothetical protein